MTLTIGRTSGLRPTRARPTYDGAGVVVDGVYVASSTDALRAARQQLLGLQGNADEEVVPVVWATDSTLDGFYRPSNVRVDVLGPPATATRMRFSVRLDRLSSGHRSPWFEVATQSVVRTNSHSVTTPSGVVAAFQAPSSDSQYEMGDTIKTISPSAHTLDTGDTIYRFKRSAPMSLTGFRFATSPPKFYAGSCVVEVRRSGTWYPVVGREGLEAGAVWRISNGLVRLTSVDGSTAGTVEVYNGSQWEAQSLQHASIPNFGVSSGQVTRGAHIGAGGPLAILRNGPEQVAVQVRGTEESVTWSVQRGAYLVGCTMTWYSSTEFARGLVYATNTGMTAFTGGLRRTTADASGNGLALISPSTVTYSSTTLGGLGAPSGTGLAIGLAIDDTGSTAATTLRDEWFAATTFAQRVIAR